MEDENESALAALHAMGLTAEDIATAKKLLSVPVRNTDKRICICGHPVGRHTDTGVGIANCKPTAMQCPCKRCRPVLVADDCRLFVRKTVGGGLLHALTLGSVAHLERGKKVQWINDPVCDRCGETEGTVVPVPVTQGGHAKSHATGYDVLLCSKCREDV